MLPLHTGPLKKCVEGPLTLPPGLDTTTPPGARNIGSGAAAVLERPYQFGLKSRYTDQRQLRLDDEMSGESAVTCGPGWDRSLPIYRSSEREIRGRASDDKLLPLISPPHHRTCDPFYKPTSLQIFDWLVNWADNDIVMLITPTQLPKVATPSLFSQSVGVRSSEFVVLTTDRRGLSPYQP